MYSVSGEYGLVSEYFAKDPAFMAVEARCFALLNMTERTLFTCEARKGRKKP
jgi:hypothetical protein